MNKVDWHEVITAINRKYRWPMKTIAWHVDTSLSGLSNWKYGLCEPPYSKGVKLLKLAGMVDG